MNQRRVVSLFSGIAGIERGLKPHRFDPLMFCEMGPIAHAILTREYPDVPIYDDVRTLASIPECDLVTAGFPCQDLSQQGRTAGINGPKSGLVQKLFKLLSNSRRGHMPDVLIENVPNMLSLDRGAAMNYLVEQLESLGYRWAYRTVDVRGFGLQQRRLRVYLYASTHRHPADVLLVDDTDVVKESRDMPDGVACGFSWTEGKTGLGWCVDAVPTIKVGSSLGIASPPAVVMPDRSLVTIGLEDAEYLQGFPRGFTELPIKRGTKEYSTYRRARWRLVGNAVCPRVLSDWLGKRLIHPGEANKRIETSDNIADKWPRAGWGGRGARWKSSMSTRPIHWHDSHPAHWPQSLDEVLHATRPMTQRQVSGFLNRTRKGRLHFPNGFIKVVEAYARKKEEEFREYVENDS